MFHTPFPLEFFCVNGEVKKGCLTAAFHAFTQPLHVCRDQHVNGQALHLLDETQHMESM